MEKTRMLVRALFAALVCCLLLPAAQARTLEVGEGKEFAAPSDAAAAAQDGDRVEIHPGSYFDCAVWRASNLTIAGIGAADKVVVTDKSCQGKALFVTVGNAIEVRNLTLTTVSPLPSALMPAPLPSGTRARVSVRLRWRRDKWRRRRPR